MTEKNHNVVIAGGTGFIGRQLAIRLQGAGYQVVILTRTPLKKPIDPIIQQVHWDGINLGDWQAEIEGAEAVVNLAGASIAGEDLLSILFGRWTADRKTTILKSRIDAGRVLGLAVAKSRRKPRVLIQASGIGYYGTTVQPGLTEKDPPGADFLASVSTQWEESSRAVTAAGVRHAVIRSGVVLHPSGGILPLIALPIRLFIGGRLGSGRQPFPWIHLEDEIRAIQFLIESDRAAGAYNLVAPGQASSMEFGSKLARILHRPFYLPVPAWILKFVLGEKSTLVLEGQDALPARLTREGFRFQFPDPETALADLYRSRS